MKQSQTEVTKPTKYCLACSYVLDGLPENRCPECGRMFHHGDAHTFGLRAKIKNNGVPVVLMYLLPLTLSIAVWAAADSSRWHGTGYGMVLQDRLMVGLWQACGPLAWVTLETRTTSDVAILGIFSVSWTVWLTLVSKTRLRQLPYLLHLAFGFLWCFAGCPPTGLVVT